MNYNTLLDVTSELGYRLAMSGAETCRVEESVKRIFAAYGMDVEVFSIPNCLIISFEAETGKPVTSMRRIGHHGTDLDAVEKYNSVSRKICAETPEPEIALEWVNETTKTNRQYSLWVYLLGSIIGASGFILVYGGSVSDGLIAALCGLFAGFINKFMGSLKINMFFSTIASAFVIALTAYILGLTGIVTSTDGVIISALMLLVPGLLFTNAMRDIIYGDTNSGINRIVQVLLIGVAIALGTGAAWSAMKAFGSDQILSTPIQHGLVAETVTTFVACIGFSILFNIHGKGIVLCALGGAATWVIFKAAQMGGISMVIACLLATIFAATYSEIMARVRKYPAISYLVVSVIPLLPGAGVYRTTASVMQSDMAGFSSYGLETVSIAGALAVGILVVSTLARLWNTKHPKTSYAKNK